MSITTHHGHMARQLALSLNVTGSEANAVEYWADTEERYEAIQCVIESIMPSAPRMREPRDTHCRDCGCPFLVTRSNAIEFWACPNASAEQLQRRRVYGGSVTCGDSPAARRDRARAAVLKLVGYVDPHDAPAASADADPRAR